ncbi:MAG TPA: tetratricopeptide repeat protein [Gemmatimonadales bacterium]|jgi:putative nucleotidyltransferase with HDIG domain|nr:tetratricopeptide repeat protein [Gemmatimonadales bacterium]
MQSLGEARASAPFVLPAIVLQQARERERAGAIPEAIERYQTAIAGAERVGDQRILAEALRRLAVVRHQRGDTDPARELCLRSYGVGLRIDDPALAAEALNTLGGMDVATGALEDARETFLLALDLGGESQALRARAEQNLGIIANIQGQLNEAVSRYERSLDAYRSSGDVHGCALAYHNLGMVSADRGRLDAADCYFRESRAFAERVGDVHLWALCLVNHAEVHVARQRFEDARQNAESALGVFDQLGVRAPKADAYRVIGMVYRETGRPALAESRLKSAIDFANAAGSVLGEAEACRELAILHQAMGRNEEALRMLNVAYRLFRRLDARLELVHVGGKMAELEGTYLALVREWGRSLESTDNYTYGHCERVAKNAVAMARALGLDEHAETTILLGAYLHDLGQVRVPHEILKKTGPLSTSQQQVLQMHPIWGIELLANAEFPWDLKPIIRSHHEHYDGTGYPDRLKGDEIPLYAQIVGILDVYDSLTTTRGDQPGMTVDQAVADITRQRGWWSDRVFETFLQVIAVNAPPRPATRAAEESAESQ